MPTSKGSEIGGSLLPGDFLRPAVAERFAGRLGEGTRDQAHMRFARWWRRCEREAGPATTLRVLVETLGRSLFALLGFELNDTVVGTPRSVAVSRIVARGARALPVLTTRWGHDLDGCWREAVRAGLSAGSPWTLCWNIRELRLVDASRPWGRHHLSFDLATCAGDAKAFAPFWAVVRPDALGIGPSVGGPRNAPSLIDELVLHAAAEQARVCTGLETGVIQSLPLLAAAFLRSARGGSTTAAIDLQSQSLTVIYRILFLLFAESRSLVPMWHTIYRESYSIEALREAVMLRRPTPGLWPALQAASRLAHRGCRFGSLAVTPFNGHLFAPQHTPAAETAVVSDATLLQVIEALTTTPVNGRARSRIAFEDLGVEQLGAIYEHVLDHRLVIDAPRPDVPGARAGRRAGLRVRLETTRQQRKASGTFYTPRALTHLIVRRTLTPLVDGASSQEILALRVLDPSMGSGAFLVAACDFLARAYERALVHEGQFHGHELNDDDRAGFRRLVARCCLYGVDSNPMAVHLARLSLWLATLARDVPLTFLDHHLRLGDSLLGASVNDLLRQAPGRGARRDRWNAPSLFPIGAMLDELDAALPLHGQLAGIPDDSLDAVRRKEALLEQMRERNAPLSRWREAADVWCSAWFWPDRSSEPSAAFYRELLASVLGRGQQLPGRHVDEARATARELAVRLRFFHWTLEFPDVFASPGGAGGFDAVIGNPPWDVIRADAGSASDKGTSSRLWRFVRDTGIYSGSAESHGNVFLLFVERALQVVRHGGRVGMVVPAGLLSDHGASRVRRRLFEQCNVDTCFVMDNRRALFPIHRSVKFAVVSATRGRATRAIPLLHVPGEAAALDGCSDGPTPDAPVVPIPVAWLERVSGQSLAVPRLQTRQELALLEYLSQSAPRISSPDGWQATFGRELNATDDRGLFHSGGDGLPILEGKHISAFRVRPQQASLVLPEGVARSRLPARPYLRARLAYRDVASASNERTLIAAVVPAGCVTTHTLFCCRRTLDIAHLHALCALFNSFVANWFVRRWVSTHVTVSLVERLPVPTAAVLGTRLHALSRLSQQLAREDAASARLEKEAILQASVASAWRLSPTQLALILDDFPLISHQLKRMTQAHHERQWCRRRVSQ